MRSPASALARRIVELACLAPSVHNTQPWRWRVTGDSVVELYADRGRQLLVSDPTGRNLALSCGAAIHHGVVAARGMGRTADVELVPSADQDLLARIRLAPGVATEGDLAALASLRRRCTDRRRFTSWPVPETRLQHLSNEATSHRGVLISPITDVTDRFRTEELVKRAMAAQGADPRFADEQGDWVDHSTVDGVRASNAAPASYGRPPTPPTRFAAEVADGSSRAAIESSDGLMAICTARDDQQSWLEAGRALSALWLQATRGGLSIVPLSQVVEVDETRHALHHDIFDGMARPQILVRVGWQEIGRTPLARTPRRPVTEVIDR